MVDFLGAHWPSWVRLLMQGVTSRVQHSDGNAHLVLSEPRTHLSYSESIAVLDEGQLDPMELLKAQERGLRAMARIVWENHEAGGGRLRVPDAVMPKWEG